MIPKTGTPSRDLIRSWDQEVPDDELQIVKERAKEAGMSFTDFIRAELDGKPTMRAVPFVQFARSVSMETVGPECSEFLKRPDVLRHVKLPRGLLVAVQERLAEADCTLAEVDNADYEVLKAVRDTWQALNQKTRRKGFVLSR